LDPKGRITVPRRFREVLAGFNSGSTVVVVADAQCLQVYPLEAWERLVELKMREKSPFDPSARAFGRLFASRGRDTDMDGAGWILDGTVGMGGHAEAMLSGTGDDIRLLGLDRDPEALRRAGHRLAPFADRVRLAHANFLALADVARAHGVTSARAILLDLGV